MHKRTFIKSIALAGMGASLSGTALAAWARKAAQKSPAELASDDDFWNSIRGSYKLKPDYINLESGYYNILPEPVLEQYLSHIREVNYQGSYYMRTVQLQNKKNMAAGLARLAGCSPDELIITRNATESLDMVIGGQNWKPGDEAVMAEQDYGSMLEMFRQVSKRYGVINKLVSVPNHPQSDEEIVSLYENAITDKTRLLMVCHMINITGQILPIRKICDMAHRKGVQVMVDGAHAFAHIRFSIPDLDCDYYGTSLHKWLCVPLGAGFLYVKKTHIHEVWPLLADSGKNEDDIARLNHIGTHPVATDLTIANAIEFYEMIGAERKESRLRFLQQYWTGRLRKVPGVVVNTPEDPQRACGIANVGIEKMKPAALADTLMKKYRIFTVAIDYANVHGCRITPNVFTTTTELDELVRAIKELSAA